MAARARVNSQAPGATPSPARLCAPNHVTPLSRQHEAEDGAGEADRDLAAHGALPLHAYRKVPARAIPFQIASGHGPC